MWSDTTNYPPSKLVNNNSDFYMALVSNPPVPSLMLKNFVIPFTPPQMMIETVTVSGLPNHDVEPAAYSAATYSFQIRSTHVSKPLVTVNGLVVAEGRSAVTETNTFQPPYDDRDQEYTTLATGDYRTTNGYRYITFFPQTVVNGDNLTFMYDSVGGSNGQFFTLPATVSTLNTEMIYEENGYYYINLDKQSVGGVVISVNGVVQSKYEKVSDSRIQLLTPISEYKEGDVFALFFKTIYTLIGTSMNKEPQIPVSYHKNKTLKDTINVKLFNDNGDVVQNLTDTVQTSELGAIYRSFQLIPPAPGKYRYIVSISRQYPLLNGESIYATNQTDLISFEITKDTFYSPSGIALGNNYNPGNSGIANAT